MDDGDRGCSLRCLGLAILASLLFWVVLIALGFVVLRDTINW